MGRYLAIVAGVTLEITEKEQDFHPLSLTNEKESFLFSPHAVSRQTDVHINIAPSVTPPGVRGTLLMKGRSWCINKTGESFLGYHYLHKQPELPSWWFVADHEFKDITVGFNTQVLSRDKYNFNVLDWSNQLNFRLLIPLLVHHGVLLFHASGGDVNGKGFLMAAPSGTGKSTIAGRLANHGHQIYCDERIAVKQHEKNGWEIYGTPWFSSVNLCRNESAPLAALMFLKQSRETGLRRLSKAESIKRMLQVCSIPWHFPGITEKALNICEEMIAGCPIFELSCTNDEEPVQVIEELAESS